MDIVEKSSWIKFEEVSKDCGKFVFSPLEKGMGVTIGNSLRRVLLSSLSGFSITKIQIDGVEHEFSSIPNVVEDTLDIIANLKSFRFLNHIFYNICSGKIIFDD